MRAKRYVLYLLGLSVLGCEVGAERGQLASWSSDGSDEQAVREAERVLWTSGVEVQAINRMGVYERRPLRAGEEFVHFWPATYVRNAFALSVWAPPTTERMAQLDAWPREDEGERLARELPVVVESALFPGGRIPMNYQEQSGIDQHDARFEWCILCGIDEDPALDVGHRVRFIAGENVVGELYVRFIR